MKSYEIGSRPAARKRRLISTTSFDQHCTKRYIQHDRSQASKAHICTSLGKKNGRELPDLQETCGQLHAWYDTEPVSDWQIIQTVWFLLCFCRGLALQSRMVCVSIYSTGSYCDQDADKRFLAGRSVHSNCKDSSNWFATIASSPALSPFFSWRTKDQVARTGSMQVWEFKVLTL